MGVIDPFEDGVGASMRTAVHGYCREHRDQVATGFPDAMRQLGEVKFMGDPPADLRPGDVEAFMAYVDRERIGLASALGVPVERADGSLDVPPSDCPHCGSTLAWDDGPHVLEAAQRGNARAWNCPNCGAAGMLMAAAD
jgi:predicted RNA-binding Zn-ribbon protein involved in translation (DUF1610 family)